MRFLANSLSENEGPGCADVLAIPEINSLPADTCAVQWYYVGRPLCNIPAE